MFSYLLFDIFQNGTVNGRDGKGSLEDWKELNEGRKAQRN